MLIKKSMGLTKHNLGAIFIIFLLLTFAGCTDLFNKSEETKYITKFPENSSDYDATKYDLDRDGVPDSDDDLPLDPRDYRDTDGDELGDRTEEGLGTDPNNPDTDGDTISDGVEVSRKLNPLEKDTDMDGIEDNKDAFPNDSSKGQIYIDPQTGIKGLFHGEGEDSSNTNKTHLKMDLDFDGKADYLKSTENVFNNEFVKTNVPKLFELYPNLTVINITTELFDNNSDGNGDYVHIRINGELFGKQVHKKLSFWAYVKNILNNENMHYENIGNQTNGTMSD